MKNSAIAAGLAIAVIAIVLGVVKVKNELAMTKAYEAQAREQKRVADILRDERDLKAVEFSASMRCTIQRGRTIRTKNGGDLYFVANIITYPGDVEEAGIKTSVTCWEK